MSDDISNLRLPNDGTDGDEDEETELFATVTEMLGDGRVEVQCADGETRIARIPGRMRKRVWIRQDDLVIVEPWEWQDEKAEIKYRYEEDEARAIRESDDVDL